jgi:2-hydroxyacyl-CoA lyase 1
MRKDLTEVLFVASVPPMALLPNARYEQVMSAFGGKGYYVRTRESLRMALQECLANTETPSLINVMISPTAGRKPQVGLA